MPYSTSKTILARDVIGQAIELVANDETRTLLKSLRVQYYNLALTEIFNILVSLIDTESIIMRNEGTLTELDFTKHLGYDLNSAAFDNYDKIIGIELKTSSLGDPIYDVERVPLVEFLKHKKNKEASEPYDEMVIYTELSRDSDGGRLEFLVGASIITLTVPVLVIYYTRQPTLLTNATLETAKMDLPDKYMTLLILRIASYAELRMGITDKSFTMLKMTYEQLLASIEPTLRTKIMNTLYPKDEE